MNKKVIIIIISILICISVIIISFSYEDGNTTNKLQSGLAFYVYDNSLQDYSATNNIPVGNIYLLNETLSYCKGNGEIGEYDSLNGTISYVFSSGDSCYVYFEYEKESPVISNLVATDDTVTATLTDNAQLASYIVSTSESAPSIGYTEISGTSYNLSYSTKTSGTNTYYLYVKDSAGNITKSSSFSLTYTPPPAATTTLINLGVMATDEHTVSGTTYTNYRFTGANPNNYACLSSDGTTCINYSKDNATNKTAGLFRIIGVFNEDTHGVADTQLVKLISADKLGSMVWDYKQSGVGSSTNKFGSNDWSDSQLMYMLNGFVNTGYNGSTQLHTGYSYISNIYYISDGTTLIYQLNNGLSYLTGAGTTAPLYKPAITEPFGWLSTDTVDVQTLTNTQANMIATTTWHLGGYSSYSIKTSAFYTYERGTTTCYSAGNCSTTERPTTWTGKIGLMYPSDYGYATSGGTTTRNTCLTSYNLGSWNSYNDCYTNDWLLYPGARTGTQGTASHQWTISPRSSTACIVFLVGSGGSASSNATNLSYGVRSAFYLESDVSLAGGSGTSTDPYLFVRN